MLVPKDDLATQEKLSDELHDMNAVTSIISYVDTVGTEIPESYLDADTLKKLMSDHYARMVINVEEETEGEEAFALVKDIRACAEKYYPGEWYLAGEGVSTCDLMDTITSDMAKVNLVAIGAVFVVLLFTMRSLVLPVILVLSIETAVWLNFAILFTERYKECRQSMGKKDAVIADISSTAVSMLTSGRTCGKIRGAYDPCTGGEK